MNVKTSSSKNVVTIAISIFITTIVYNIVTIFGLLTFGSKIEGDLMVSYDASNVMVMVGIIIVAFKAVLTYPPVLFCARLAVDDIVVNLSRGLTEESEKTRRITIVLFWVLSNIVLAIYVPDISSTIDVTGTLAILFIFFLPGIVLIYAVTDNRVNTTSRTNYYLLAFTGIFYVLVGTFIFGVTITQIIMKDFTQGSKSVPIHLCT